MHTKNIQCVRKKLDIKIYIWKMLKCIWKILACIKNVSDVYEKYRMCTKNVDMLKKENKKTKKTGEN